MKLASVKLYGQEKACIKMPFGYVLLEQINKHLNHHWSCDIWSLLQSGELENLNNWYCSDGKHNMGKLKDVAIPDDKVVFAPLYRNPRKIWAIGLNYKEHAADISAEIPEEPASFMKPDTTIIGYGDYIKIPWQSKETHGEAELGIIIGCQCKNVKPEDWLSVVAGFTTSLDMTTMDILRRSLRYLARAKSFDTFFSFGPQFLTPDEFSDFSSLRISTVLNGEIRASNVIANMIFPLDFLVSFHSQVMTLCPGDVIITGTPGGVHIKNGDNIECRIDGFQPLLNPVKG
ncbi:fumarylacetoacetate hydrolase family protein [Candidatus Poribacteria bacterium]|nr:fumarylacetoacetate hydrolase family protein [Candidatus Poribacteria bacterium]